MSRTKRASGFGWILSIRGDHPARHEPRQEGQHPAEHGDPRRHPPCPGPPLDLSGCCRGLSGPDGDARLADVAQAVPRVAIEAPPQQALDARRRLGRQRRPIDLARQDRREYVRHGLAVEEPLAREHLEEHDAEGPDVGALVHGPAAGLLGGHVGGGAEDEPGRGPGVGEGGRLPTGRRTCPETDSAAYALARPKSRTLTLPSGVTFTLAGLRSRWTMPFSWASSRPSAICFAMARASSTGIGPRIRRSARSSPSTSSMAMRWTRGPVGEACRLEAVEVGDRRVVERGEQPGLALEAGEPLGIGGEGLGQPLERHLAPELRVGGAVDLAHAARADRGGDPVVRESLADQGRAPPDLSKGTTGVEFERRV